MLYEKINQVSNLLAVSEEKTIRYEYILKLSKKGGDKWD